MLTLPLPARRGEEAAAGAAGRGRPAARQSGVQQAARRPAAVGAGPPGQRREGRRAAPLFGKEE